MITSYSYYIAIFALFQAIYGLFMHLYFIYTKHIKGWKNTKTNNTKQMEGYHDADDFKMVRK